MFLPDQDQIRNLYTKHYIDVLCQILIHLANWLQRSRFFSASVNPKQDSHVFILSGWNKKTLLRTSYRCFTSNIYSSGQTVSGEDSLVFQSIRNKNCPWQQCYFYLILTGNEKTLYRTFHRCFIPNVNPFGQAVFREKEF